MTTTTDPVVVPALGSCEKDMIQEIADAIEVRQVPAFEGDASVFDGINTFWNLELLTTEFLLDTTELFFDGGNIPTGRRFYAGAYYLGITLDPTWHDPEHPKRFRYEVELL